MRACLDLSAVPWKHDHLSPKFKHLVCIAVDAAATHLHVPGVRRHIRLALDHGATQDEIMEVIELTSTLGIHAMNIGVPLLVEVLEERGRSGPAPLDDFQEGLKAEFAATRGYWHEFWDEMLELDPELFQAYTAFSSVPWHHGTLTPAEKELIYIAFDCAATHLYVPGLKLHIRNALNHGATAQQVLTTMELAVALGMQAATVAAPILVEEVASRRAVSEAS
jgi:alkylhydroperoxidase/carboxymuconolactone decarboxylase family protein YurZ